MYGHQIVVDDFVITTHDSIRLTLIPNLTFHLVLAIKSLSPFHKIQEWQVNFYNMHTHYAQVLLQSTLITLNNSAPPWIFPYPVTGIKVPKMHMKITFTLDSQKDRLYFHIKSESFTFSYLSPQEEYSLSFREGRCSHRFPDLSWD